MAAANNRKQIIFIAGTVLAVMALLVYLGAQEYAPKKKDAAKQEGAAVAKVLGPATITVSEQNTLGIKAAPALEQQYGGLSTNEEQKALIARVGGLLAAREEVVTSGWKFQFQLLAEPDILNAFALPGGQVYVTTGLLNRLTTEGEVAAVLAHQVAHVLQRDAIIKLAADMEETGLTGADAAAMMPSQLVGLRFTTAQETAADTRAVKLLGDTGYSPKALLGLLKVLSTAYYAGAEVEYFTTHPNAANRVQNIQAAIAVAYPDGVPESMSE